MTGNGGFQRILAGVGFGPCTTNVLKTSAALANEYGASLKVVYAHHFEPPVYFPSKRAAQDVSEQMDAAITHLDRVAADAIGDGCDYETELINSPEVDGILKAGKASKSDLIVLGARRSIRNRVFASTPENVIRATDTPVLTVREEKHGPVVPFEKILCPVNFTPVGNEAFAQAADLAARFEASLTAMAVLEAGDAGSERTREDARAELESLVGGAAEIEDRVDPVVRRGEADEEILKTVRDGGYDLVVLGAQHRPLLEATIYGSTSMRVIRHAPCAVLSIVRT